MRDSEVSSDGGSLGRGEGRAEPVSAYSSVSQKASSQESCMDQTGLLVTELIVFSSTVGLRFLYNVLL